MGNAVCRRYHIKNLLQEEWNYGFLQGGQKVQFLWKKKNMCFHVLKRTAYQVPLVKEINRNPLGIFMKLQSTGMPNMESGFIEWIWAVRSQSPFLGQGRIHIWKTSIREKSTAFCLSDTCSASKCDVWLVGCRCHAVYNWYLPRGIHLEPCNYNRFQASWTNYCWTAYFTSTSWAGPCSP